MATLAEQISLLANPAPTFQDSDEIDDVTAAQVTPKPEQDEAEDLAPSTSKLRQRAAALLNEDDTRYAGRKVSRKTLQDEDRSPEADEDNTETAEDESEEAEEVNIQHEADEEIEEDAESDADSNEDEKILSFKAKMKATNSGSNPEFSFEDDGDYSKYAENSQDDSGGDSEDDSSDGEEEDDSTDGEEEDDSTDGEEEDDSTDGEEEDGEEEGGVSHFSKFHLEDEVKKGEATQVQLGLWDQLLKTRIELQKVGLLVNQLPHPEMWDLFKKQGGDDYYTALHKGQAAIEKVLGKVFQLQTALLLQNPETSTLTEGGSTQKVKVPDEDEEITSESEVEAEEGQKPQPKQKGKHKLGLEDYPEVLAKRHKGFQQYRNDTIQKWYDKTRVATGRISRGFSAFDQSALKQIQQIMTDRDRLVKRTQLNRSSHRVLGKPEKTVADEENSQVEDDMMEPHISSRDKDYDVEIFDDSDFYHQLLREFIEKKTADVKDPVALSRHWLAIQKMRRKVKKKVDTRASKGRKIRYDIFPKLVNFMAPMDVSQWTDEARDDLYSSLFGKRKVTEEEEAR